MMLISAMSRIVNTAANMKNVTCTVADEMSLIAARVGSRS